MVEFIQGLHGTPSLTIEEGTSAAWLRDLLQPHVSRLVVCKPRKNALWPGRKRRAKVGRKSDAIDLYQKRKTDALQGKKLPEKFRAETVSFEALAKDALEYSKAHKSSYQHDKYRMAGLADAFGNRAADSVTPQDFERWTADRELTPATANRS